MISEVRGAVVDGIAAHLIKIETHIRPGLAKVDLVGLADKAVREARVRVRSAILETGIAFPSDVISINLSPGQLRKDGTGLDLPLAVGIVAASLAGDGGGWERLRDLVLVGELALDGRLRPVPGVLPIALEARRWEVGGLVVPVANVLEGSLAEGLAVYGATTLGEVLEHIAGKRDLPRADPPRSWPARHEGAGVRLGEIGGQFLAKRALVLAAAGGHNILMVGPPGAGKTLLARALPALLPPLSNAEAVEVTKVHSVANLVGAEGGWITERPFRAPHHSITREGLIGGGATPRPGEVALAHRGVLFLDEVPEFERGALESLRQPLESGCVRITRQMRSVVFPARFLLVGAMNPCRCGHYATSPRCRCSNFEVSRYTSRVSGPLLDRIDLQVLVDRVKFEDLHAPERPEDDEERVRESIALARHAQEMRYGPGKANGDLSGAQIRRVVRLDAASRRLLSNAMSGEQLSARAHDRILKVARTIADLEGEAEVAKHHILEAVQYRKMDRILV